MASRILAGRYELLEKMGEGGMAVVFKARDRLLNRYVAIKILRPEFTKDSAFIESFRRESQMAAGPSHPNIVSVYDVGKESNIYFIVMELMTGEALSDVIKKNGALDPRTAVNITRQVASGLSAAHKNHLIHRDVKPHNIMFAQDGTAKITDFGIAKVVTGDTLVGGEKKENVMGSVHYFSPEQAKGGYVDEKSDIYSLGICLYEMLTGKVPFDGESAVEVAVKHMNEPMVPPREVNPDIPQDLEDIILKATSKDPERRYRTMDDMIFALNFVSYGKHNDLDVTAELKPEVNNLAASDEFLFRKEAKKETPAAEAPAEPVNDETIIPAESHKHEKKVKAAAAEPAVKTKKVFFHPQRYIAVILAVLLAIPMSSVLSGFMSKAEVINPPAEVNVPSVIDMTTEDAVATLAEYNLNLVVEFELISKDVEVGHIISQTPAADSVVKEGQTIKVNVSKGTVNASVPNVAGKSYANAKAVLETYGYKVAISGKVEDKAIAKDYIVSQNPKAGTQLEQGKTVSLTISLGPPASAVTSPEFNLVGYTFDEAQNVLNELGLRLGTVSYKTSTSVPEGSVISHTPGVGSAPPAGTSVDFIVSTGNTSQGGTGGGGNSGELVIDGSVDLDINFGKVPEETNAFILKVTIADSNGSRTFTEECVREDYSKTVTVSGAGQGAKVYVSFDNTMAYNFTVDFTTGTYTGGAVQ
ncbi:MAG: Stk1 family PASTA domain-containing Ser/Thr kinase [Firmicutes bacterium]|nr:Stk1 family PASTA domain-containing Ser/Thr kinase [Bacillota bacterium]